MTQRFRIYALAGVLLGGLLSVIPLSAQTSNLTGTYTADDGGIYSMQQAGNTLWWAGMSLDQNLTPDVQWHRGLNFTNVFSGTINPDGTVTGQWSDVTRGLALNSGSMTLLIGSSNGMSQLTKLGATGGFGGSVWTQTNPLDDTLVNGTALDLSSRFVSVYKNDAADDSTLQDNLKPYRDQTVVYGRFVFERLNNGSPTHVAPHVNYGTDYSGGNPQPLFWDFGDGLRDYTSFACDTVSSPGPQDGDMDMDLRIDLDKLEPAFYSTGWGDVNLGPLVFALKFGDPVSRQLLDYADNEAHLHLESIMYGLQGNHNCTGALPGPSILPGWADANSNSLLVNGRPINGAAFNTGFDPNCLFIEPCPYVVGNTDSDGIQVGNRLIAGMGDGAYPPGTGDSNYPPSAYAYDGTYARVSGALVLDCGHGYNSPCYDDPFFPDDIASTQNQEIHPIYSIDIINFPLRPEDSAYSARMNLTGTWGGADGSTYYVRQIGNTIWWLGQVRDRQPIQNYWGTESPMIGTPALLQDFQAGNPACSSSPPQCWSFANVFRGTISNNPDGSASITGNWAGVPQSTSGGSTGGSMTFSVDAQHKFITVTDPTSIFPIPIQKLYEPEDQTPPQSTLAIGTPQYNVAGILTFVTSATQLTESATDADSGVENLWYRVYPQNASPVPSYAPVIASSLSFNITGADGMYNFDEYATDNAGNDENANHGFVYLDNTPPVATITQPALTQYTHSNTLVLAYSVSDGTGSGVKSSTPTIDGSPTLPDGTVLVGAGQSIPLLTLPLGTHTFSVSSSDNLNNAGANSVTFSIAATPDSVKTDVNLFQTLGCISNGGIATSLVAKINAAEALISQGQLQAAANTLSAFVYEVQAQAGQHIPATCTAGGHRYSPAQTLIADAQFVQTTLAGQLGANPIIGSAVTSNNAAVSGAVVTLWSSSKAVISTATTDSAGMYYFAGTAGLTPGNNYSLSVALPKGYKGSTPATQAFAWSGEGVSLAPFILN